jgi:hypothetical protein
MNDAHTAAASTQHMRCHNHNVCMPHAPCIRNSIQMHGGWHRLEVNSSFLHTIHARM